MIKLINGLILLGAIGIVFISCQFNKIDKQDMTSDKFYVKIEDTSTRKGKPPFEFLDVNLTLGNNSAKDCWFVFSDAINIETEVTISNVRAIEVRKFKGQEKHIKIFNDRHSFIAIKVNANENVKMDQFEFSYQTGEQAKDGKMIVAELIEFEGGSIDKLLEVGGVLETPDEIDNTEETYIKSHKLDSTQTITLQTPTVIDCNFSSN